MNLTPEREAHLRYMAGTDNAMRDAMGMLDRARSERDTERVASGAWQSIATLAAKLLRANVHAGAQPVTRGGEVDGIEPRAAADAPQRYDAGSGLGDLTAGRADVGDGVGGEGGHDPYATTRRGAAMAVDMLFAAAFPSGRISGASQSESDDWLALMRATIPERVIAKIRDDADRALAEFAEGYRNEAFIGDVKVTR